MSATADDQRTLESFGYEQELKRSVSTVDLLIYGLVFMVPIAWCHVVRRRSRNWLLHGVVPVLGLLIIGSVLLNADVPAKAGGLVWLAIGAVVFGINVARGRRPEPTIREDVPVEDRAL